MKCHRTVQNLFESSNGFSSRNTSSGRTVFAITRSSKQGRVYKITGEEFEC